LDIQKNLSNYPVKKFTMEGHEKHRENHSGTDELGEASISRNQTI